MEVERETGFVRVNIIPSGKHLNMICTQFSVQIIIQLDYKALLMDVFLYITGGIHFVFD